MQQNRKTAKGGEYFCKALYVLTLSLHFSISVFLLCLNSPPFYSRTLIPAVRHFMTASGTVARGGSIMEMSPAKHKPDVVKFISSESNL